MKRKFWSLLLLLLLAFLLISCEQLNLFESDNLFKDTEEVQTVATIPDPAAHVARILDLIKQDDTESLLEWVYPSALEKYGREQIIDRNQKIHSGIGLNEIELNDFQPLANNQRENLISYQGTAVYKTEYGDIEKSVTYNFIYHPKDTRWQLDWTPSVILPGLHDYGLVQVIPLKANRGEIFDREGKPLAHRSFIKRVGVVPQSLRNEDIPAIEQGFELPEGFIAEQIAQDWVASDTFVPIKTVIDLSETQQQLIDSYHLTVQQMESRSYPLGAAAAHLIGYVGFPTAEDLAKEEYAGLTSQDFIGKSGLEAIYDQQLRGENGFKVVVTGDYQQVLLEKQAVNGKNLYLTIDSDLQQEIYDLNQDRNATFTAMDPRNGDLLALVSTPSYDPHQFVLGISQSDYDELLNNPYNPLFNKFAQALTPGSTEKILTSVAGFNAGTLTEDTGYDIQGKGWTYDPSWGNHQVIRYTVIDGLIDFESAIVNSDNIYFARVALDMGMQAYNEQMQNLQFGQSIAADYPFGVSQITNNGPVTDTILLADAGYGQGELMIPQAHMASIYGAIANGGAWYRPRLLLTTPEEKITERIVSGDHLASLNRAMRKVCTNTYPDLNFSAAKLAGKSGTAEVGYDAENDMVRVNSSFISYDQNLNNMVLAVTCFDTHLIGRFEAVNATRNIFQKLYQDGAYDPPRAVDVRQE